MSNLIAERYEIVATIGVGGVGTVYKVFDPPLKKNFAIKVLQHNADEAKAARLQREAMAAGKLNHPHICRIDNFGQTQDGSPYMVMEYLEGQDLSEYLKNDGAFSLENALAIAIQVSGALAYAHQHKIVHRDLKPANVLLLEHSSEIFVKLLDFGVAKVEAQRGDITQAGAIIGSPLYMSPEQIKGEDIDGTTDIYSFGCMLFEILTGEPPFVGNSVVETFSMHKSKDAPSLSNYGNFPVDLTNLIMQCLSKEPANRPSSANEVLKRLEKIQEDVLNPAPEASSQSDTTSAADQNKNRRKRLVLVITCTAVILLVVLAVSLIGKDITSRQAVPVSVLAEKSGLDQAADEFFDESGDRKKMFIPDSKRGEYSKRAVPSVVDKDLKLLEGQKLLKLSFDGSQINGSGLKYVVNSGIRQLRMQQVDVTDENMKYVAQMKDLNNLSINSNMLSDKGLEYISDARKFHTLEIQSDLVTNKGIASIKHLNNCIHLSFRGSAMTIDCVKAIGPSRNLQTLELGKFNVSGDLGSLLVVFPRLQRIDFADLKSLDADSLRSLAKKKLKAINIIRSTLGKEQLEALSELKDIQTLSLYKCDLDIDGLKYFERMPELIILHLTENQNISGKGVAYLSKIEKLHVLNLSKSNINADDLAQILTMPNLNLIDVSDCLNLPKEAIEKFKLDHKARYGHECRVNY